MIRVLVAEDSPTVQELLVGMLDEDPDIRVVGRAGNGAEAVDLAVRLRPDLIAMDIHMPVLDGLAATKEIMVRAPAPIVIVSSSSSRVDLDLSFDAIRAGALMLVKKPDKPASPQFGEQREHFLAMVKTMAQVKVVRRWAARDRDRSGAAASESRTRSRRPARPARLIAIAASTGGPAALQRILADLPGDYPLPILVVQHLSAGFAEPFAEWLGAGCGLRVKVAERGEALLPRTIYLAPDGRHLGVDGDRRVSLSRDAPIDGHRPSATRLFETAGRACGPATTAVVLTGMGRDGVAGLREVRNRGGFVIAQDEASSIVYGMPREAAEAGLVDEIVPLEEIGRRLREAAAGGMHANANPGR